MSFKSNDGQIMSILQSHHNSLDSTENAKSYSGLATPRQKGFSLSPHGKTVKLLMLIKRRKRDKDQYKETFKFS